MLRVYGPWWEGRYRCTYRRDDGQWKFETVFFRLVAPDKDRDVSCPARAGQETVVNGASRPEGGRE
jgi:hypothetical protein